MNQHTGRTVFASVVFFDIVGYSREAGAQQYAMKPVRNATIQEALTDIATSERIVLDTGDGAALRFVGDPEDALFVATAIRDATLRRDGDGAHSLRVGINLGPVRSVTDLNGPTNVAGDGINVAERVMSCAEEDELPVSRSCCEVVARKSGDRIGPIARVLALKAAQGADSRAIAVRPARREHRQPRRSRALPRRGEQRRVLMPHPGTRCPY